MGQQDYADPALDAGLSPPAWDGGVAVDAWRLPEQRSVSSAVARFGMQGAERYGIGPQEFQRRTGISAWDLQSPQTRICAEKHLAMMRLVQQMPVPQDCWQMDIHACLQPFPTLYAVVANAPNLVAGLGAFFQHRSLIGNVDTLTCLRDGAQFEFGYQLDDSGGTSLSAFGNFFLLNGLVRHYDAQGGRARVLELTGAPFSAAAVLRDAMGCEVRFGQARNRLLLQAPASDQPYAQHNPTLYAFFQAQARSEQAQLEPPQTFALGLQRFLADAIAAGDAIGSGSQLLAQACAHFKTS
uniref:AraC family transcriptional regulator ligand-binding domain-containing protein n=1 Tax=Rhodoferax sp. TaxID=50421 RepID=UPI00374D10C2